MTTSEMNELKSNLQSMLIKLTVIETKLDIHKGRGQRIRNLEIAVYGLIAFMVAHGFGLRVPGLS